MPVHDGPVEYKRLGGLEAISYDHDARCCIKYKQRGKPERRLEVQVEVYSDSESLSGQKNDDDASGDLNRDTVTLAVSNTSDVLAPETLLYQIQATA